MPRPLLWLSTNRQKIELFLDPACCLYIQNVMTRSDLPSPELHIALKWVPNVKSLPPSRRFDKFTQHFQEVAISHSNFSHFSQREAPNEFIIVWALFRSKLNIIIKCIIENENKYHRRKKEDETPSFPRLDTIYVLTLLIWKTLDGVYFEIWSGVQRTCHHKYPQETPALAFYPHWV